MVGEKCRSCLYYAAYTDTCDYMLVTHERRGCPAGDECVRYRPSVGATTLADYYVGRAKLSDRDRMLLELYEKGCSDTQIEKATGIPRTSVSHWRARMGLPSQREIEVASRDG